MFSLDHTSIFALLTHYGYAIIFPISILEGPIIAIIAGFLVSLGKLNGILVFIILVLGDLTGDSLYYGLGRFGGRSFVLRYGKYIRMSEEKVLRLEKYFGTHDWKIILFSKTQPIGSALLFSAGMAKMPYEKYLWYNLLGTLPKVLIFELIGFYFGQGYAQIGGYINIAGISSFILGALLIAAYWLLKKYTKIDTEKVP